MNHPAPVPASQTRGPISYRALIASGLLVAVLVGLLLWFVPRPEQDLYADLAEPIKSAAKACGIELRLTRQQAANFVSEIKDGRFKIGSEIKEGVGPSDYQGCLDRRLGVKTSNTQNEIAASDVLARAKAYEELFREYKVTRDQLDKERSDKLAARADLLAKQLADARRAVSSSSIEVSASYGSFGGGAKASASSTSNVVQHTTVPAVPTDAVAAWNSCVEAASPSSASGKCSEIVAASVSSQLNAAVGLGRFADPVYFLLRPIAWRPDSGSTLAPVRVPSGFVVTFESIPRMFWSLLRPDGSAGLAAIIHDYLYWIQDRPRAQADEIFRLALMESVHDKTVVEALYQAVRSFGEVAWNENAKLKAQGVQRVLKQFPDSPTIKWDDWKNVPGVFKG